MKNNTYKVKLTSTLLLLFCTSVASAETESKAEHYLNRKGDHIDRHLDRKGDRIEHRYNHKADRARLAGKDGLANQLEKKGAFANSRLDHKSDRINRKLDRKGDRVNRHLDRKGQRHSRRH